MLGFGTQDTEWIVLFERLQEMYSALVGILPWLWVIPLCLMSPYWCSRKLKTTLFLVKAISTLHLLLKLWGSTSNCSRNYNYCPWVSSHNWPSLRQYKKWLRKISLVVSLVSGLSSKCLEADKETTMQYMVITTCTSGSNKVQPNGQTLVQVCWWSRCNKPFWLIMRLLIVPRDWIK